LTFGIIKINYELIDTFRKMTAKGTLTYYNTIDIYKLEKRLNYVDIKNLIERDCA
jgi:hypothetical protein